MTVTFDLLSPKLGHATDRSCWLYVPIWKFIEFFVLKYEAINADLVAALLGNHFVPQSLGRRPHVMPRVW